MTMKSKNDFSFFGTQPIGKLLWTLAPPVMLSQLIQAFYNIADSFFVGNFSNDGVTALSVIYPVQLLLLAVAVGTGVGVNTVMAKFYGHGDNEKAAETAGTGLFLALIGWGVFAVLSVLLLEPFIRICAQSQQVRDYTLTYGRIVCVGSLGVFIESNQSKVLQAQGNMKTPMIAQITGALTNIVLDPILIFGWGFIPKMDIAGAAVATVIGQFVSAAIVSAKSLCKPPRFSEMSPLIRDIYKLGAPSIVMQALYTTYIAGLNLVLVGFSDAAVTVLGLYYKWQAFFFIPLFGLQTCVVPIISYNNAVGRQDRCRKILRCSILISASFMILGMIGFIFFPAQLIGLFSSDEKTLEIGVTAFRIISLCFLPASLSLMYPVYFQALGKGRESVFVTIFRQVILLVPLAWVFSFFGLDYVWITFPVTEILTSALALYYDRKIQKSSQQSLEP
ncbi:MAG: MATE family efflux transporter [Clostridiales bacterium]|nr:MATE family efflux transporter [Clostridiales bacterium]